MYAIIQTGGKQYRVGPGQVLNVERLDGPVGTKLTFNEVLLVGGKDKDTAVGSPYVSGAAVEAEIVEQTRAPKILTIKYKRRQGYRRTMGHRQEVTRLLFTKISSGSDSVSLDAKNRAEVLVVNSVKFSTRQADHQAKHKKADGSSRPKKKAAAPKKQVAAPKSAPAKKTAPKKATASKAKKKN